MICCVFNFNPLYRFPIYKKMSETFDMHFYFGDYGEEQNARLKQFDPYKLKGFKGYHKFVTLFKGFRWSKGVWNILNRKYDAYVITGDPSFLINWIIILYAKIFGKDVYCWCHGLKEYVRRGKNRLFLGVFYKSMSGVFMYNKYNCKYMEDLGVPSEKLHVIHNSLDTDLHTQLYRFAEKTKVYTEHFGNSDPVVIFIGRIQKRMKIHLLIEAQDYLAKKGCNLNVVIVGHNIDGEDIEQLVNLKGLSERVWFYGPSWDEKNNSELLYNADVCVAPGTIGLTAIHSLSYGTPCITHNNFQQIGPEFEAIEDGVTGTFFEEDDVESLAKSIQQWIGLSEEKREEIRKRAREVIERNWSVDYQINLLKKVFDESTVDN